MARKNAAPRTPDGADEPAEQAPNTAMIVRTNTRPTNKDKHPGLLDLPRYNPDNPLRVPTPPPEHRAKVRAARQATEDAKKVAQLNRNAATQRAAKLLEKTANEDALAANLRRNPPAPLPKKKIQPRPVVKPSVTKQNSAASKLSTTSSQVHFNASHATTESHEGQSHNQALELQPEADPSRLSDRSETPKHSWKSDGTGSEFEPDGDADDAESSVDGDCMDVEEDEVEQTCHKRAQNSKRVRRAHVTAAREATREAEDSAPKRKAAPTSSGNCDNTVPPHKKTKTVPIVGGIRRDFAQHFETPSKTPRPDMSTTSLTHATPVKLSKSQKGKERALKPICAPNSPPVSANGVSDQGPDGDGGPIDIDEFTGGMADDDLDKALNDFKDDADAALTWIDNHVAHNLLSDDEDGRPMHESTYRSRHYHPSIDGPSSSAQESTDAVIPKRAVKMAAVRHVDLNTPAASGHQKGAKGNKKDSEGRFVVKDIPFEMQRDYHDKLAPFIRLYHGIRQPFTELTIEECQCLFDIAYPEYDHKITDSDDDIFYQMAIKDRTSDWQSAFRKYALSSLREHFDNTKDLASPEQRAAYCIRMLALDDNESTRRDKLKQMRVPFYWRKWNHAHDKSGRFENPLILKTLGLAHLTAINQASEEVIDVFNDVFNTPKPAGALVMASLAVEFALTYWRTGKKVIPSSTDGHFSAENWGDQEMRDPDDPKKRIMQVKVLSHFEHAQAFDDARWDSMLATARQHLKTRKKKVMNQRARIVNLDERPVMASSD